MQAIKTRLKETLHTRSGDTLVEVMASIFIFLLMMGILQGAVAYSSASLRKNQEIREENSKILESIKKAEPQLTGGNVEETFCAANSDLTETGDKVFTVKTGLYEIQAEGVRFALYRTEPGSGTGGEEP